jgi:hypothetical protein
MMDKLYAFAYRGILTDEALDKVGRQRRRFARDEELAQFQDALSYDMLDLDLLGDAQRMAVVYAAVHAFENTVRSLVQKAMSEAHGETWWEKVPEKIRKRVESRQSEDAKFKWHGARGAAQIHYCDFGDLSSVVVTNWQVFEDVLGDMEWAKAILGTLERSRNIVMHGGLLAKEDVERIGVNIRDWIRQAG